MERSCIKYIVGCSADHLKGNHLRESIDLNKSGLFWEVDFEEYVKNHLAREAFTAGLIIYDENDFFNTYCFPIKCGSNQGRDTNHITLSKERYHKIKVIF